MVEKRPARPRMTIPTQLALRALLAEPTQEMYGLQICEQAGLPSGTIHPILARLEYEYGWVTSHWEDIKPQEEGRPRRRYYRLTGDGAECARIALAQATTSVTTLGLWPRPAATTITANSVTHATRTDADGTPAIHPRAATYSTGKTPQPPRRPLPHGSDPYALPLTPVSVRRIVQRRTGMEFRP